MWKNNITVGVFVAGGLLLFGAGLFLIGDRRQAFGEHVEYYSEFQNLAGLANGAMVRVGGMDGGEVLSISVPDSPASRFRVRWKIGSKLRGLVRSDSVTTIETEGVVGGTFLAVSPGTPRGRQAAALATIPSKEPIDLSELLTRGTGLLNDAQSMLKEVGGKLSGTLDEASTTIGNVNEIAVGLRQGRGAAGMLLRDQKFANDIRQTVTNSTSSVDEILAGMKAGRGPAGMLLRDEALAGQIRDAVKNVQQATADLGQASQQAAALVADLNKQQIPQKAGMAVDNLNQSTQQVHEMLSQINEPDRQGMTATANIRESLDNVNAASLSMADETEALKHNFLLRGFFRRRGYYNLDRISAERYRQDSAFTNRANSRAWLAASELFQDGANGQEQLSVAGKALLDGTLTESGDAIFESPIVIEGYCNGVGPADQLRLSRSRAILVRQYLQSRFQLDTSNLGVVAMKNSPPSGVERKTWDGICIVVLKNKSK